MSLKLNGLVNLNELEGLNQLENLIGDFIVSSLDNNLNSKLNDFILTLKQVYKFEIVEINKHSLLLTLNDRDFRIAITPIGQRELHRDYCKYNRIKTINYLNELICPVLFYSKGLMVTPHGEYVNGGFSVKDIMKNCSNLGVGFFEDEVDKQFKRFGNDVLFTDYSSLYIESVV